MAIPAKNEGLLFFRLEVPTSINSGFFLYFAKQREIDMDPAVTTVSLSNEKSPFTTLPFGQNSIS